MLLVHEVVAQTRATTRDATACEEDIEFAERGGYAQDEQAVTEADRSVPRTDQYSGLA